MRKVWRDPRGSVTGVRRVCARSAAGPSPKGAEGRGLERSGISPVGNPRMARVSNHADPRSSYRGSKSTPQVDFEPRGLPAAGSVTEMPGTPRFLPCCPTPTYALSTFGSLWGTKSRQRDPGLSVPARRSLRGPSGAGECDVPGISATDPAEVWRLSDPIVTEVRLRNVPVPPLPRKPHVLGSSWGSQPARTPHEEPRTPAPISDGHPPARIHIPTLGPLSRVRIGKLIQREGSS